MPSNFDQVVRQAVYQHFVRTGEAPRIDALAASLSESLPTVIDAVRRLSDAHALVLRPQSNEIWMAMPFSSVPTGFRVRARGRTWWGNCAWDALGIAAALRCDAEIETTCALDGAPMRLSVDDGRLRGDGFVHFAVPAAHWWDDIGFT